MLTAPKATRQSGTELLLGFCFLCRDLWDGGIEGLTLWFMGFIQVYGVYIYISGFSGLIRVDRKSLAESCRGSKSSS